MLGLIFITFLYQALYLRGIPFILDVGIKVSPVDIVLLFFLSFHLINLFIGKIKVKFPFPLNYILFFLFIMSMIEFFSVIFIDKGKPENITLAISIIRNFILIYLMVNLVTPNVRMAKLIVLIALINSIIAIFFYLKALNNIFSIISNPDLWEPGIFYTLDRGILRLQGLSDDPNFFFIVNFVGLVFSLSLIDNQKFIKEKIFFLVSLIIILLANILTFSRTGFIILILFLIFFLFINFFKYYKYIPILLILLSSLIIYFGDIVKSRFISGIETGGSGRLYLWNVALEGFIESPIWGQGGRYTLKVAGNYTHNDILEILSSHGLIGMMPLIIMYTYLILVFIKMAKKITKYCNYVKSYTFFVNMVLVFLTYLLAHFFFTIFYNPYIWFVIGLLIALNNYIKSHCNEYWRVRYAVGNININK